MKPALKRPASGSAQTEGGDSERSRAGFPVALALSVLVAFGGFLVLMGAVLLLHPPVNITKGLPLKQNQNAETLLYLAAFCVVAPFGLLAGSRLADRLSAGPNREGLGALCAILAGGLAGVLVLLKKSGPFPWGDGVESVLAGCLAWAVVSAVIVWRALRPRRWNLLAAIPAGIAWIVAGLLTFASLLCVVDPDSISVGAASIGAVIVIGALFSYDRLGVPRPRRRVRVAIDVILLVLLVLAVPDLIIVNPADEILGVPLAHTVQFHQNFLLGPANSVIHGKAMLVDTTSQYGVGDIYFLAGWFKIAPIGYGTLSLLSGLLSSLVFASAYCILRFSGTQRLLAASTMAVAVGVLVLNTPYPIDAIPQDSALRLGLPIAAVLGVIAAERFPQRSRVLLGLALLVVGIAAIWSLEGLAYTLATLLGMAFVDSALRPGSERLPRLATQATWVVGACVVTQVLLALATLAFAGQLPDWGQYFTYLHDFLFGRLADLNYDYGRWSPGLAVGAVYLASVLAAGLILARKPDFAKRERVALIAIGGLTTYGIASYSYFNNRSSSFVLAAVSLPALISGALWLSMILRSRGDISIGVRRGALAAGTSVAVLLVSIAWSSVDYRFPNSALGIALPGGRTPSDAMHRLWNFPPLDPAAPEGVRLLDRYMPGEDHSLVIAKPDLETEILLRAKRINALPLAAPWQDSFVPSVRRQDLVDAVEDLKAGDQILINGNARQGFATMRANPDLDPLAGDVVLQSLGRTPNRMAPLQLLALKLLGERFDLRQVHAGSNGMEIVELMPRGSRRRSPGRDSNS